MKNILLCITIILSGCSGQKNSLPHIVIETEMGDIEAELYPDKAPKTVAAFLNYIDSGYYKKAAFYRVVLQEGFSPEANTGVIQGGTWAVKDLKLPGIPHESTQVSKLTHSSGILSLARNEPGTGTTEFFICIGDQPQYDYGGRGNADGQGYAAFGKVTKGMKVARDIQQQRANGENFVKRVLIKNIVRE